MNIIKNYLAEHRLIKEFFLPILFCILIPFILEVSLFNFRHFQTRSFTPSVGMAYTVSSNMELKDNNIYQIKSLDEKPYIDVDVSGLDIRDVYLDFWPNAEVFNTDRLRMHYFVVDEGNVLGYDLPQISYVRGAWQSMYTYVDFSGKCNGFRIYIDEGLSVDQLIRIESIGFNVPVPFDVSKKRILGIAIILILLYFLRPSSIIYNKIFKENFSGKKAIIFVVLVAEAALMYKAATMNVACQIAPYESQHQFEMLAESLSQGKFYLLKDVPDELISMDNPYSFQARLQNGVQDEIMYDVAYYNGKYYVYFGVGPIITCYLPYYLITGTHLQTYLLVYMLCVIVSAGWLFLSYELCKKYFNEIPFALYLVCSVLFTASCGITYVVSRPDFYAVPMTMSLASTLFGLAFWIKSIKPLTDGTYIIQPCCAFFGSLFMAFVAACRPQFLLGSFLAVILFYNAVFIDRKLFSKQSLSATICFILPYILIASGLMYYNYARFGSVFDFGANYNLTFNDMAYRGFHINRLLYATIGFMFIPAKIINTFPYFTPAAYTSRYMGYISDEQLLGGLFYNCLYLLSIVFIPKAQKIVKDKPIYVISLVNIVFAVVIMIVDANMAGVLNRYFVDFSWLIIISFFILFGYAITDEGLVLYRPIINITFYILAILAFIHMFFMVFGGDVNGLINNGILEFERMSHMIEFWN